MIHFEIPLHPRPKGRPRFSRKSGTTYTPKRTADAERDFLVLAMVHRPSEPFDGPLALTLIFRYPYPKVGKWKREAAKGSVYHRLEKPDLDNLVKMVKDALSGPFWRNDSQIVVLNTMKLYGEGPGTLVWIRELEHMRTAAEWKAWSLGDGDTHLLKSASGAIVTPEAPVT